MVVVGTFHKLHFNTGISFSAHFCVKWPNINRLQNEVKIGLVDEFGGKSIVKRQNGQGDGQKKSKAFGAPRKEEEKRDEEKGLSS